MQDGLLAVTLLGNSTTLLRDSGYVRFLTQFYSINGSRILVDSRSELLDRARTPIDQATCR